MQKSAQKLMQKATVMPLWKKMVISIIILTFSAAVCLLAIAYSNDNLSQRVYNDMIHQVFEFKYAYFIIAQTLLTAISLLFFGYIIKKSRYEDLPAFFFCLAIFYLIRAVFVLIFPLKDIFPVQRSGLWYDYFPTGGMFPSGHTGLAFMTYYFVKGNLRYVFFAIALLISLFLIISRMHYTIDIVGAILITQIIFAGMKKYKNMHGDKITFF